MELKSYQKKVIEDLSEYFGFFQKLKDPAYAFDKYWQEKTGVSTQVTGQVMYSYKDNVPGAIHLCIKVPTAGGKTFIACNALKTIFNNMPEGRPKAVVWLVPWSNLLDQTVKNLSDPDHPYCRKLNALFENRVTVYQKKDLLFAAGFNPSSAKEQLSIMVLNFSSLKTKNKDDRKIFEENENLASFVQTSPDRSHVLPGTDESALINVIRSLNPVLIVDESHNAESELSVDMLRNLNPSFILDLTATPKDNANIISFVPAIELKKEHMVKLPVIVYNHKDRTSVIESAFHLQQKLEMLAIQHQQEGGKYIRPIVLFQAQSKTKKEDSTTFYKLKEQLILMNIPEERIKIKTADINELEDVDLMSPDCPVRYIITINALKEGWDCPFAYILASLADRSSEVDVTQILGRVLRQPYVMRHRDLLNLSYVITASAKFNETLQSIVKGLKEAGFSEKDYREKNEMDEHTNAEKEYSPGSSRIMNFDSRYIPNDIESAIASYSATEEIFSIAEKESVQMEEQLSAHWQEDNSLTHLFSELGESIKLYGMREAVAPLAKPLLLPRFVMKRPRMQFFSDSDTELLDRVNLLDGFLLNKEDANISLDHSSSELYQIDIEETRINDSRMSSFKVGEQWHNQLINYILAKPREGQIKDIASQVMNQIGKVYPIPDQDIRQYVMRILDQLDNEQLKDILRHTYYCSERIKDKIADLADKHAEKIFSEWQVIGKISTQPQWKFPEMIPASESMDIGNSLYVKEAEMNGLEQKFALEISACDNIAFWHRNLGKGKGFSLNGYKSNHYPDFIIVTKKGIVVLVETKGGDRDNSDSFSKIQLGAAWEKLSGPGYKYMMVFEKNAPQGAYNLEKAKELINQM